VSWHAINLWEPEGEGESHPLRVIQRAAWRNKIGLKILPADGIPDTPMPMHPPKRVEPELRFSKAVKRSLSAPADQKIDQALATNAGSA
jgi:hypothetical protein